MVFKLTIFILLLLAGYSLSRKIKKSKISLSLVSVFLLFIFAAFIVLSKKLFAMAGFSLYLLLIVLGFGIGILAGLDNHKKS